LASIEQLSQRLGQCISRPPGKDIADPPCRFENPSLLA
jgi:hypothetical protein